MSRVVSFSIRQLMMILSVLSEHEVSRRRCIGKACTCSGGTVPGLAPALSELRLYMATSTTCITLAAELSCLEESHPAQ